MQRHRSGSNPFGDAWILLLIALFLLLLSGCQQQTPIACCSDTGVVSLDHIKAVTVPGDSEWVHTRLFVESGETITVSATGVISHRKAKRGPEGEPSEVGPAGTYHFLDQEAEREFPVASAAAGPAPCYGLIGKIGTGEPFFIGAEKSWIVEQSGWLFLGINDFDVSDNSGEFHVEFHQHQTPQPIHYEQQVTAQAPAGQPVKQASVVVFYVDGLRPDVVREMAALGHLPTIQEHFLAGGTWVRDAFTAFPSDTITSNGTMWTGCFSDRHGLKGQVRFSRRTLNSDSYLEPLGPNRSARLLSPQGVDRVVQQTRQETARVTGGAEAAERVRQRQTSGTPPLYAHLREQGRDWGTGVLPVMTEVPPLLWTRSMARQLPYLQVKDAWKYIDDANSHYATKHLLNKDNPVTIIWLPETDSVSHKQSRGQFGMTRRTIARADLLMGKLIDELKAQKRLESTYLILVSDHGHHGGRISHLSNFDLTNDFFFKAREVTTEGRRLGGGLGISARAHRAWSRHPQDRSQEFVFVDGSSDGVARVFLPVGHFRSQRWMGGPNQAADLLNYRINENQPPVNLVEALTAIRAPHANGFIETPIDLVLMKLSAESILISTGDRGAAVVDRRKDNRGKWQCRYRVVAPPQVNEQGGITLNEIPQPQTDPLGIIAACGPQVLNRYFDEKHWLRLTAGTQYPDGIVTLTRHLLWDEKLEYREEEYAPDLVVTARENWYFGTHSSPGTMHGFPFPDAMRASFFVSGPNIRRGAVVTDPARLVDLTPTILEMVGHPANPSEVDGIPLRTIYTPDTPDSQTTSVPIRWSDVDLQGWSPLIYEATPPSPRLPVSINQPESPWDLNNIAYNLLSLSDVPVLRLADDVLFPWKKGDGPLVRQAEYTEHLLRRSRFPWVSGATNAVDVTGLAVGDYNPYSLGNLQRMDRGLDWTQERIRELEAVLASPWGREELLLLQPLHWSADRLQISFWDLYRFSQRVMMQVLDETVLNGVEDTTDRVRNAIPREPAEIVVPE